MGFKRPIGKNLNRIAYKRIYKRFIRGLGISNYKSIGCSLIDGRCSDLNCECRYSRIAEKGDMAKQKTLIVNQSLVSVCECVFPSPPLHHKPHPCHNHNQAGQPIKPFTHSVADSIHHLSHQYQSWRGTDAEEHHHQSALHHPGKGMMSLHTAPCSGEQGGVGEAAGEKTENDSHRVVGAKGSRGLEELHNLLHK